MNLRTAESVSPKHPDKICDQISDSIVDAALLIDPGSRVAVESVGGHKLLTIIGEVTSKAKIDYERIARGFVDDSFEIRIQVVHQSSEIASGVDTGGAGDQGIMVGYATNETASNLPLEVELSRSLNRYLYDKFPYDGKTQVSLSNDEIVAVVASFQHAKKKDLVVLINNWLKQHKRSSIVDVLANPAGDWKLGGFDADTGLTGRKLAVDSYGPRIPIGGGAFSGKDASKVDRSAAYMARKIAVDYLHKRQAREVFTQLAYAIGVAEPVEAVVTIDGIEEIIEGYDLTPKGIISYLKLDKPQFELTARYGHFGNNFLWDRPTK
ncbi:MAG: methionine adenosyltransferase domain-containing protein [Candidatus Saccharimonadales bacterium]